MTRPSTDLGSLYVFTTLRWDPLLLESRQNTAASLNRPCPFYMLEHHWTRLQVAKWGTAWYDTSAPSTKSSAFLQILLSAIEQWQNAHNNESPESLRIKFRYYVCGKISTEITPTPRVSLSTLFPSRFPTPDNTCDISWTVVLDVEATEPSEVTMFKTFDRSCYNRARAYAGIENYTTKKEVIMFTPDRQIMDATLSTPYFWRDGRWTAPGSSSGGQQGATRRWALENGLAVEGTITVDSLRDGEIVWLSNAVKGYFPAKFCTAAPA